MTPLESALIAAAAMALAWVISEVVLHWHARHRPTEHERWVAARDATGHIHSHETLPK